MVWPRAHHKELLTFSIGFVVQVCPGTLIWLVKDNKGLLWNSILSRFIKTPLFHHAAGPAESFIAPRATVFIIINLYIAEGLFLCQIFFIKD